MVSTKDSMYNELISILPKVNISFLLQLVCVNVREIVCSIANSNSRTHDHGRTSLKTFQINVSIGMNRLGAVVLA